MVLEVSKSFVHNSCSDREQKYSDKELQNIMLRLMNEHGISTEEVTINNDGSIEMNGMPNLKLHSMLLQAEELGLAIKYTKKTVIEIC